MYISGFLDYFHHVWNHYYASILTWKSFTAQPQTNWNSFLVAQTEKANTSIIIVLQLKKITWNEKLFLNHFSNAVFNCKCNRSNNALTTDAKHYDIILLMIRDRPHWRNKCLVIVYQRSFLVIQLGYMLRLLLITQIKPWTGLNILYMWGFLKQI